MKLRISGESLKIMLLKEVRELRSVYLNVLVAIITIPLPAWINWYTKGDIGVGSSQIVAFLPAIWGFVIGGQIMQKMLADEKKKKTLPIVLLSPSSPFTILFTKICIPFLSGFLVFFLSTAVNDVFILVTKNSYMVFSFTPVKIFFTVLAVLFICLMTLFAYLWLDNATNESMVPFILVSFAVVYGLLYVYIVAGAFLFVIAGVLLNIAMISICVFLLKQIKKEKTKPRKINVADSFPSKAVGRTGGLFLKELAEIRTVGFRYISFLIVLLLPTLLMRNYMDRGINPQLFIFLLFSPACIWACVNILYPSKQREKIEGTDLILRTAGVSTLRENAVKSLFSLTITGLHLFLSISVAVMLFPAVVPFFTAGHIIGLILGALCSVIICLLVSSRIKSYKEAMFHETIISISAIMMHFVIYFIAFK